MPGVRQARFYAHPQIQPDVQNVYGRYRGRKKRGVSAAGNGTGHFCKFRQHPAHHTAQAAVWRVPGGQGVPQRDHAGQLRVPHARIRADGVRILLQARHRSGMVCLLERDVQKLACQPWAEPRAPAPARSRAGGACVLQQRHHGY